MLLPDGLGARRAGGEAEHGGNVQRVASGGAGFVEDTVLAKLRGHGW
jgi:hypothetical protein